MNMGLESFSYEFDLHVLFIYFSYRFDVHHLYITDVVNYNASMLYTLLYIQ